MTSWFAAEPLRRRIRLLCRAEGTSLEEVAQRLKVDRSTLVRVFTRERLRADAADRLAVALGSHPCELWPEWFDISSR